MTDAPAEADRREPVSFVRTHLRLPFRWHADAVTARLHRALKAGEIYGTRCTVCRSVYVPPRGICARCWARCDGWERISDVGTVTTFVVVNVPFYGQEIELPYVLANVLLDGSNTAFQHLVGVRNDAGRLIAPPEIVVGTRVRAVWRDAVDRQGWLNDDIDHFTPNGEPPRSAAELEQHL